MKKYTFTDGGYTFQRIDKKAARRAYNNGLRVMLCPVNLRPGYPYHPETSISGKAAATFEEALNAFEFYNIRFFSFRRFMLLNDLFLNAQFIKK